MLLISIIEKKGRYDGKLVHELMEKGNVIIGVVVDYQAFEWNCFGVVLPACCSDN
jgi:hypothetical protein